MHNRAQELGRLSLERVSRGDREGWLALFDDDAQVQDPYGVSNFDPSGQGFRGKAALAAFWDSVIAGNRIEGEIRESYPAGDCCANVMTTRTWRPGHAVLEVSSVTVYRASGTGRLSHLTAYWSLD
jgi:steroid delta-isomerase